VSKHNMGGVILRDEPPFSLSHKRRVKPQHAYLKEGRTAPMSMVRKRMVFSVIGASAKKKSPQVDFILSL
jgi:hypothetical protein